MKFLFTSPSAKVASVLFDATIPAHQYSSEKSPTLRIKINKESYSLVALLVLFREIIQVAKSHQIRELSVDWKSIKNISKGLKLDAAFLATLYAENVLMANYSFSFYKKQEKKSFSGVEKMYLNIETPLMKEVRKGIDEGVTRGTHINWCRNLANTPGNDMTPALFATEVKRAVAKEKNKNLFVKILEEKEIQRLGMGGVVAVGKGSKEASKFIILEYRGGKKGDDTVALVGKGVTFDSGGIDTKPHPYALEMMMDMSGGAAVITATLLAAKLKLKKNIVALVPAVENMPSL